jgi:DNA modification methylase
MIQILQGDCRDVLKTLPDCSVHCCVTSPPYFGLRDYGCAGQIGLESTPDAYVAELVAVFREVRRVLRDDGTLWLNLGDSYSGSGKGPAGNLGKIHNEREIKQTSGIVPDGLKPKDLIGIPWRVAFALQADGWYLRQDIIWAKPNPMPESVRDRCTKAHEYIFLLAKSERYYYDAEAIAEPVAVSTVERLSQPTLAQQEGSWRVPGKTNGAMKAVGPRFGGQKYGDSDDPKHATKSGNVYPIPGPDARRNKRSVWTVTTKPYREAHFATFPPDLIRPCIRAGCPPAGKRCDCDEIILSPTGSGEIEDPSMETGRAGMNRPRRENEGSRPITRREQRHEAEEMRASRHKAEMEAECGPAFAHYIRTDKSGARPLPESIRRKFQDRGWITQAPPCPHPIEPAGTVLDPFGGSGTTGEVAASEGRKAILIELNPEYVKLAKNRGGLFYTSNPGADRMANEKGEKE